MLMISNSQKRYAILRLFWIGLFSDELHYHDEVSKFPCSKKYIYIYIYIYICIVSECKKTTKMLEIRIMDNLDPFGLRWKWKGVE